ncbi:MAG: flagellar basal body rod protein FlgC [Candidatus Aureabacteria bacterium]|nr:flagellar basal body rod protein FlgC [Candidatus Auribacterota bacterium]
MLDDAFEIMNISASAMSAERRRMGLIANNIANTNTTRGANGEPYRRKYAIFKTLLDKNIADIDDAGSLKEKGVVLDRVETDTSPFLSVYDPNHPDADDKGFVQYPNINLVEEMVDLVASSRAYEANVKVMMATKSMMNKALELLKI